jgi:hypothetical protein
MTPGDWLITSLGAATALGGVALLAWSLLADRLRTRRARRDGTLRRCPKCWYDMTATGGLTCPECGKTAKHERRLACARRRRRWVLVSALAITLGAAAIAYPHSRAGVWVRWLPDTAIILLIPRTESPWPIQEMERRQRVLKPRYDPSLPEPMWDWQRRMLASACIQVIEDQSRVADGELAWRLLSARAPLTTQVIDTMIDRFGRDDLTDQVHSMCLLRDRLTDLSQAELKRARTSIESLQESGALGEWSEGALEVLDAELATHGSDFRRKRLEWAEQVELSPDAILANGQVLTQGQLPTLLRRFGLPPPRFGLPAEGVMWGVRGGGPFTLRETRWSPVWGTATTSPTLTVLLPTASSVFLDDDDTPDRLLTLGDDLSLVLLRRGEQWELAGWFEHDILASARVYLSHICGGERWICVPSWNSTGSVDAWYRVINGRLRLMQVVLVAREESTRNGVLSRQLRSDPPRVVQKDGRCFVRYNMHAEAKLSLHLSVRPARWVGTIWARDGEFDYPLTRDPTSRGVANAPGPWQGRAADWLLGCTDEELLVEAGPWLTQALQQGDEAERRAIRNFLRSLEPSAQMQNLQDSLPVEPP